MNKVNVPRARALTEDELLAIPPPRWEHEPWTQRGGCTLLIGPPGSFKSTVLAMLLGTSATGGVTDGGARAQRQGPVFAVVGEDLPGWTARWRAWRRGAHIPEDVSLPLHTFAAPVNLFSGEGFTDLLDEVEAVNPIVIGLDPLSDLITGADEDKSKDMGRVRDRCKRLMDGGRSLLLCQHTGWNETRERGSTLPRGFADTRILLHATERGEVTVRCRKQRNLTPFSPVTLRFDPERHVLCARASAEPSPVTESLCETVLAWVRANPAQSTDAIARAIGRRKAHVIAALTSLKASGVLASGTKGHATTWELQATVPGTVPVSTGPGTVQ